MGSRVESVPCPRSIYGESSDGVVEETSTIPEHFSIFAFDAWSDGPCTSGASFNGEEGSGAKPPSHAAHGQAGQGCEHLSPQDVDCTTVVVSSGPQCLPGVSHRPSHCSDVSVTSHPGPHFPRTQTHTHRPPPPGLAESNCALSICTANPPWQVGHPSNHWPRTCTVASKSSYAAHRFCCCQPRQTVAVGQQAPRAQHLLSPPGPPGRHGDAAWKTGTKLPPRPDCWVSMYPTRPLDVSH